MTPKVILNALAALGASSALFSLEVGAPAVEVTAANITISWLATAATASSQIGAVASADIAIGYATATATTTLAGPVP